MAIGHLRLRLDPERRAEGNGGLALLRTGDRIRVDLRARRADMLVPDDEIARRCAEPEAAGSYRAPESKSPWQALFREKVRPFDAGAVLEGATAYRDIAARHLPRDNH
ncbi:dihydroxy-acid dehydratase [Rhodovulum sp. 12E13]|uniref:dihydroxy-acid dehydratase domain-containing protein n=1 Tax=Rhodovulum sp. 12E13 TaxID=2203891 RepID=UPI0026A4882F